MLRVSKKLKIYELVETRNAVEKQEFVDLKVSNPQHCPKVDGQVYESTDLVAVGLKIETEGTKVKEVKDTVGRSSSCEYETGLEISYQETLFFPTNLGEKFPQLEQLSVTHSGLYEIGFEIFEGMNSLKLLNLTGNKLQEITNEQKFPKASKNHRGTIAIDSV